MPEYKLIANATDFDSGDPETIWNFTVSHLSISTWEIRKVESLFKNLSWTMIIKHLLQQIISFRKSSQFPIASLNLAKDKILKQLLI